MIHTACRSRRKRTPMPKQRYDPANFDALDDERKLWLIRYDLEEECHDATTKDVMSIHDEEASNDEQ